MAWRLRPRVPWLLPASRDSVMEAMQVLAATQRDSDQAQLENEKQKRRRQKRGPSSGSHLGRWKRSFLERVGNMTDTEILDQAHSLIGQHDEAGSTSSLEKKQQDVRLKGAASVFACKYFVDRSKSSLSRQFLFELLTKQNENENNDVERGGKNHAEAEAEAEEEEVVGASSDKRAGPSLSPRYDRAVDVTLRGLAQEGRYEEAFELASAVLFGFEAEAIGERNKGRIPLSNTRLQTIIVALKHLGDAELLQKSWEALLYGDEQLGGEREGKSLEPWKPSLGTYCLFLEACLSFDTQNQDEPRHLFAPGTYAHKALEHGRALQYSFNSQVAAVLLDHCNLADDVLRVMDLHCASHTKGRVNLMDKKETHSQGLLLNAYRDSMFPLRLQIDENQLNAYKDKNFPFMLQVLLYVKTISVNPTLLTSLIKALFRCDCSGESFAILQSCQETHLQHLQDAQPFNALVHCSAGLSSSWPIQKALELTAQFWHAPSNKAVYSIMHAIAKSSQQGRNDPLLSSSLFRILGPSYSSIGGYYLLDPISYFSGEGEGVSQLDEQERLDLSPPPQPPSPPSSSAAAASLSPRNWGQDEDQDLLEELSNDSEGEFFSNQQHTKQKLIWRIWEKYLLPIVNRKAIRQLIHCLHKVNINDGLLLQYLLSILTLASTEGEKSEFASEMINAMMHHKILRKDLVLDIFEELARKMVSLDSASLARAASALDSKERIKRPHAIENVLKVALISNGMKNETFEENLLLAIRAALIGENPSSSFGQMGLLKKTTEKTLRELGLWDTYNSLVQAGHPQDVVLQKTLTISINALTASTKGDHIEILDEAIKD